MTRASWQTYWCKLTDESNGEEKFENWSTFVKAMNEYQVARFYDPPCIFVVSLTSNIDCVTQVVRCI